MAGRVSDMFPCLIQVIDVKLVWKMSCAACLAFSSFSLMRDPLISSLNSFIAFHACRHLEQQQISSMPSCLWPVPWCPSCGQDPSAFQLFCATLLLAALFSTSLQVSSGLQLLLGILVFSSSSSSSSVSFLTFCGWLGSKHQLSN